MKYLITLFILLLSCESDNSAKIYHYKKEVLDTELAFAAMAVEEGIESAFLHYASPLAVLNRNNKAITGRDAFKSFFSNPVWKNARLEWKPVYVDAAASGDLAYTWGTYQFSVTDSSGTITESNGIFHTVWKRQADGQWKFVWD
jgi:ketosteroid isomerase-like protein